MGLLKDCTIVPLETNDSVLIGEIDKVIFYETRLYVATFSPEQAVYIFNLQGKLLHKISRKGRGAEEYLQLSDMFIDSRNRTLNLLSRIDEKLLVFDVDEYRLVKTIRLPKAFVKMVSLENGYIGYMGNYSQDKNQPYNLWAMNSRYEIESQYMKIDSRWESRMASIHSLSTYHLQTLTFIVARGRICVLTIRYVLENFICQRNNFHMMSTKNIHAIRIILQP